MRIEERAQPREALFPEALIVGDPVIHLFETDRLEAVEADTTLLALRHETGSLQHAQVLGDGRLSHAERTVDLLHRHLAIRSRRVREKVEHPPARRLGDRGEHFFDR